MNLALRQGDKSDWQDKIRWDLDGLVPVIAQDADSGRVLMFAWMNREALQLTAAQGHAVYWSRSRRKLWHKGESSGHQQKIREIRLDCDNDVILLRVEQQGRIACHTGRESCFYKRLENECWKNIDPILKDPAEIYPKHE